MEADTVKENLQKAQPVSSPEWSPVLIRKEWTIIEETVNGTEKIDGPDWTKNDRGNSYPKRQQSTDDLSPTLQRRIRYNQSPTGLNFQRQQKLMPNISQMSLQAAVYNSNQAGNKSPSSPKSHKFLKNRRSSLTKTEDTIKQDEEDGEPRIDCVVTSAVPIRRTSINGEDKSEVSDNVDDREFENELFPQNGPGCLRNRRPSLTTKEIREILQKSKRRGSLPNLSLRAEDDNLVIVGKDFISLPQDDDDIEHSETFVPPRSRRCSLPAIGVCSSSVAQKCQLSAMRKDKSTFNVPDQQDLTKNRGPVPMLVATVPAKSASKAKVNEDDEIYPKEISNNTTRRMSLPPIKQDSVLKEDIYPNQYLRKRRKSLSENNISLLLKQNTPQSSVNRRLSLPNGALNSLSSTTSNFSLAKDNNVDQEHDYQNVKGRRQSLPHNIIITYPFSKKKDTTPRRRKESITSQVRILDVEEKTTEINKIKSPDDNSVCLEGDDAKSSVSNDSDSSMTVLEEKIEETLSVSDETVLPPRTPEPEILKDYEEFEKNQAEGSNTERRNSYQPRYCWCTRCQLMYRMYKNNDDGLENWGNYPCFHF